MRYWVIAPYDSVKTNIWEKVWEFDLSEGTIAIGWELGDISKYDETKLREEIEKHYSDKNKGFKTWSFNSLWNFYHNIQIDDIIIARKGTKRIAAIGTVTHTAFYDKEMGYKRVAELHYDSYSNFIRVQWHNSPRDIEFKKPVFSFQTIYEIDEKKYKNFIENKPPNEPDFEDTVDQSEFFMEKHLEDFIVANFDKIFKGKFKLYESKNIAQQYNTTEVGIIDILAEEPKANSLVVIELKKGRESDKVIG